MRATRVNPWRELSILMVILMEVCWVTPWFRSLTPRLSAVSPVRGFIILFGMILFSHLLVRTINYLHLKKPVQRGIFVIFLVVCILVGIKSILYAQESVSLLDLINRPLHNFADLKNLLPPEFVVILAVIIAFWRGLTIAQERIGTAFVTTHFWVGITMYVAFVLVNTLSTGESPGYFFYLFIYSTLLAMCAARMTVIEMLRGGMENKINRFWLMGIVLAGLCTVGLAASLGGVVGEQFIRIVTLLFGILTIIMGLLWILFNPIITMLIDALGSFFTNTQANKSLGQGFQNLSQLLEQLNQKISNMLGKTGFSLFFEQWGSTIKLIIFVSVAVVLIVILVYWMAIKLWQDRTKSGEEEKTNLKIENIFIWLKDLLRQRLGEARKTLSQITDLNRRQRIRAAARVRQVYADLMDLCESLGQPRDDAETPLEFLPQLHQLFPALQPEASVITNAYNSVRYGQLPEIRQEVDEIEAAWKKLDSAGRELSAVQKHAKKKERRGIAHP